jgi:hypothetical protein
VAEADLLGTAMVDFAAGRSSLLWLSVASGRRLKQVDPDRHGRSLGSGRGGRVTSEPSCRLLLCSVPAGPIAWL